MSGSSDRWGKVERVREAVDRRYRGTSAEHLWNRLNAMDFINRGMLFAGMVLLCFFPFIIVVNALTGRGTVNGLVRHLGLNQQAANDLSHVFASTSATSSQVTGASSVLFVLGGIAAATAVQGLYENAYEVESRGMKDFVRRLAWLASLVGVSFLVGWTGPALRHSTGPVLTGLVAVVATTTFWWFTMWFLLAGRVHWRDLIPAAVATGLFWGGDGSRVLGDLLQRDHLRRQEVRAGRRCLRADVMVHFHRSGHHLGGGCRDRLARTAAVRGGRSQAIVCLTPEGRG